MKFILWIDFAVAAPVFAIAAYMGNNIAISFVFAGLAASFVNVLVALGAFGRPRS
jgi:hypothetical protein